MVSASFNKQIQKNKKIIQNFYLWDFIYLIFEIIGGFNVVQERFY